LFILAIEVQLLNGMQNVLAFILGRILRRERETLPYLKSRVSRGFSSLICASPGTIVGVFLRSIVKAYLSGLGLGLPLGSLALKVLLGLEVSRNLVRLLFIIAYFDVEESTIVVLHSDIGAARNPEFYIQDQPSAQPSIEA
jgi:hypothetical protein